MELNKIYQGDCLELLKQVEGESVDCIVTSPPYNKHSAKRKCIKTDSWTKANIDYGNFKDDLPEQEYQEQQKMVLRECLRVLKKDGSIFYNHKPRIVNHKTIFPHEWLNEFNVRQMIIWNRKSSPVLEPIRFMPCVEYIFWITKERKTPKFNPQAFQYKEVWEISPKPLPGHPAPFPEEVVERCLKATTEKGDVVLDPYMGSGTTAKVSKKMGRMFIGFELNPQFIEMATQEINRLSEIGETQTLIASQSTLTSQRDLILALKRSFKNETPQIPYRNFP
jgi:site-specific DNA-methyltransferase (adenine-specific)